MADPLKAPDELVDPKDIVEDDVFPDDDDDIDDVEPEEDADLENHVETEAAEAAAAPTTFTHAPELVEKAAAALYTAEEIAGMSPEVLRIAILGANRVGQAVYEANKKPEEKKPPTDEVVDELAILDDPQVYNQDVIKPIKNVVTKLQARLDKLEKENEVLRNKTGASEAQTLHQRLMGIATEATPELVKSFDVSTQAGKQTYSKLLTIMGGIWQAEKSLPEKEIFRRAVKAMDLVSEKPKDSPEIAKKKRDWDDAANAEPQRTRQRSETAVEAVGKILEARRLADKNRRAEERQARTNGQKPR